MEEAVLNKNFFTESVLQKPKLCAVANNLTLGYDNVTVCENLSFKLHCHEILAVSGESGSGKSTLLRYLRGDPRVQKIEGSFSLVDENENLYQVSKDERRNKISYISQHHNLVLRLTVLENVICGISHHISFWNILTKTIHKRFYEQALEALASVDMEKHALKRCDEISGGQQQRTAIARALVQKPSILLADEPIASLDAKNAERIFNIFEKIKQKENTAIIIILHQTSYIDQCDANLHFITKFDVLTNKFFI